MYKKDFDFSEGGKKHILSVVLMADSFFYTIFDTNKKLLGHKSYDNILFSAEDTIQALLSDQHLQTSYDHTIVTVLNDITEHLPQREDAYILNIPDFEFKNVKVQKSLVADVFTYFGLTPAQEHILDTLFGKGKYALQHWSNQLASYYMVHQESVFHVHIEVNKLFIYVQIDGKMVFYNAFVIHGNNDILYFILAVFQAVHMDPKTDLLRLSGWVTTDSALYKLLFGYIANIEMAENVNVTLNQSIDDDSVPVHCYFPHIVNVVCGS